MKSGIIKNSNSEPLYRWVFRKKDKLDEIVFFFISLTNANNARYEPLFEFTDNVRIVYFKGLRLKYTDRITLYLFRKFMIFFRHQINKYQVLHLFSLSTTFKNRIQVQHIDDPLYSKSEVSALKLWQDATINNNGIPVLICTNQYSFNWYSNILIKTKVKIIEQGFYESIKLDSDNPKKIFTCVYSSPYIHYGDDLHGMHSTWGAHILIDQIIPKLFEADPDIQIWLIGKLGRNALKKLSKYSNWHSFGRVGLFQNQEIISKCNVGIYPRLIDHKRSILKIFSYLGGGLPVVTFDLIDTSIVKEYELGPVVSNVEDFVTSILELKHSPDLVKLYKDNIEKLNSKFTWRELSRKMQLELGTLKKQQSF